MEKTITLKKTPNYQHELKLLSSVQGQTTNAYVLKTNDMSLVRKGRNESGSYYIMPGGGPLLQENNFIPKTDIFIEHISILENPRRYILILRNNDN